MDKLNCMHAFVSVVEAGGFSEAARRIGVSKAQISKQVGQLEESLGLRLLQRTTRRVSTTSSGQAYYEQCRPLLSELDELDDALQSNHATPNGELRVVAPIAFAELHLMSTVSDYSRRFPEVRLNLELTDRFVDLVEERIDVAIRIGSFAESSLVARKLGNTFMMVCASPDYLAAHAELTRPEQLAEHACVVDRNNPDASRWNLRLGENDVTIDVAARIMVNNTCAARGLLLDGQGIGYLPSFAVANDIAQGRLQQLLPQYSSKRLGIFAVYPPRKHLSAKVRLFIDSAIEHCKAACN